MGEYGTWPHCMVQFVLKLSKNTKQTVDAEKLTRPVHPRNHVKRAAVNMLNSQDIDPHRRAEAGAVLHKAACCFAGFKELSFYHLEYPYQP